MTTAALFLILLLCLLTGMPIAFALGLSSITTILLFSHDSLASIALKLLESRIGTLYPAGDSVLHPLLDFSVNRRGCRPGLSISPSTVSAGFAVAWRWPRSWPA